MSRASRLFATSLFVALGATTSVAQAQTAPEREKARKLFEDGKTKRDKGDKEGALESFEAADRIMTVPTTRLAFARALATVGRLAEAREAALSVDQLPTPPKEPLPFRDARASAAALAKELDPRVPSLTITIVPAGGATSVTVDGKVVPYGELTGRRVNPGKHVISAEFGTTRASAEPVLAEGEARTVSLERPPEAPKPAPEPVVVKGSLSPVLWVGLGVLVVGAGVGTAAGLVSSGKTSDVERLCRDGKCPPPAHSTLDEANTWATVSTGAFVFAGVGLALATVGLMLGRSEHRVQAGTSARTLVLSHDGIRGSF